MLLLAFILKKIVFRSRRLIIWFSYHFKAVVAKKIAHFYYDETIYLFPRDFLNSGFPQNMMERIMNYINLKRAQLPTRDPRNQLNVIQNEDNFRISCYNNESKNYLMEILLKFETFDEQILVISEGRLPTFNYTTVIFGEGLHADNILQKINGFNNGRTKTEKWQIIRLENIALNEYCVEFALKVKDYKNMRDLGNSFQFQENLVVMNLLELPTIQVMNITGCFFEIPQHLFITLKLMKGFMILMLVHFMYYYILLNIFIH